LPEHYEAVVVGAGPAGLAAALELAKNDVQTLILERGKTAGSKNVTGGILYGQTNTEYNLEHVVPGFEKEAPLERPIHDYLMHCMAGDKVKSLDITPLHRHDHKWSYSILRAGFDEWLAKKAHDADKKTGGGLLTGVRVTGPLLKDGRIVGVETSELEPITADLVVAADGATSELVRKAGLRGWGGSGEWFQGCKVVVRLPDARVMEDRFGLAENSGSAHLFAGDVFGGVRGGGFLYTNKDTLSIGTVFHLDSLGEKGVEPHRLMDRLLTHPMLSPWLGADAEELEYSAKLIPDGKKMSLRRPYRDNLLAVGDAAGHLQAQGPVIKGMNLGITAGILAARAHLDAKADGRPRMTGHYYTRALKNSYMQRALHPFTYKLSRLIAENDYMQDILTWMFSTPMMRRSLRQGKGTKRVERMMSSPTLAGANPDIEFGYVTLPTIVAQEAGQTFPAANGKPHIILKDKSPEASGQAVTTCPVSARGVSIGCYREETVTTLEGRQQKIIALDVQPCIECGTCAIMAKTHWEHPVGGKGVMYRYG
jgi:electron transfer flavoprotein-quinone oxidoreductase